MRTWTLSEKRQPWSTEAGLRVKPENECSFSDEELTRVIEAEPVLDLLEGQLEFLDTVTQWTGMDPDAIHEHKEDLAALLTAHGRRPVVPARERNEQ